MMSELARRRTEAWAELLARPQTFPTRARHDALLLARQNAAVAPRARAARAACRGARASLASLRRAAARGRAPGPTHEWVGCLDELLATADRVCALAGPQTP